MKKPAHRHYVAITPADVARPLTPPVNPVVETVIHIVAGQGIAPPPGLLKG